ncbi:MAG: AI-2E family transporter [Alphaproteobacteria bacterium]|nr:AI-2E family transporter [Alphaproteobacteria bacterium]
MTMNIRTYTGIWLAAFAVVVILLVLFQSILLPFVAGMAVAYFLDPVADRLEAAGLSRTLSTSIITAAFIVVVALFLIFAVPLLQGQVVDFLGNLPDYFHAARGWAEPMIERWTDKMDPGKADRAEAVIEQFSQRAAQFVLGMLGNIWAGGMALVNFLALLFITPVVTFYLLRDWDSMVARMDSWLPRAHAETIREQTRILDSTLSAFVRGTGMVCIILAVFYAATLSIAGLQFGLAIGLAAGILSFVPYLGSLGGLIICVGLAFLQFDEGWRIAVIAGIFIIGQLAEGMILTPKLVGDRIRLHPVWVIFAVLAGGTLFGFVGMLIALPVAAMLGVVIRFGVGQYLESRIYLGDDEAAKPDQASETRQP